MATAPAKVCANCHRRVPLGRPCPHCAAKRRARSDARRGSSAQRGYGGRWQRYRRGWLRAHPLCGDRLDGRSPEHSRCRAEGRPVPATVVDHIRPHRGDPELMWDPRNHQSLCKACHDAKTAREDGGFGNGQR